MIKNKIGIVTVLSLSLIFGGCSAQGSNDQPAAQASTDSSGGSNKKVELRMTWWGSQTRHDLTIKALELFQQKHPDIVIKPEYSGWDGYFDKLSTQVAGANAPDLIQMDYAFLTDYANRDALLDLDTYTQSGDLKIDKHDPSMIKAGTVNDKLYAITLGVNAPGIVYSSKVFKELNIADPDTSWTWEDFAKIAKQIREAKGDAFVGSADNSGTFNIFEIMVRQSGRSLFKDGQLGATKEDFTNWFTLWQEMRDSGSITSPEATAAMTNALETRPLALGTAAMDFIWSNQIIAFQKALKDSTDQLKIQVLPHLPGEVKSGEYLKPGQFLSGYSKTEHPKEVAMVIDFLVNDPEATAILGSERGVPVNSDIREKMATTLSDTDKMIFNFVDTVSKDKSDIDPPYPQGYSEVDKSFKTLSEQIAFAQGELGSNIDQFMTSANASLSKSK
ncbi:extracellular solute-binding protein [Paenibacillus sp. KS-LC4]|uniref:ABC transporter substrate-binding protein n=1 Tax=Paenibacillus sp. KS-LC4 TaxID=2979727 RepID=UPI0030D20B59